MNHQFSIINKGPETLNVKARSSCDCIKIDPQAFSLKPGAREQLSITYDTKEASGRVTDYIFIDSNDPENESISWLIEGTVTGTAAAAQTPAEYTEAHSSAAPSIYIFSTSNCSYCKKLKSRIIPELLNNNSKQAKVVFMPLEAPDNYKTLVMLEKQMNSPDTSLPVILINGKALSGKKVIEANLETEIRQLSLAQNNMLDTVKNTETDRTIHQKVSSLKILPIAAAGLIDGINPCAFAGIVFLVAYLGMIKRKPSKDIVFAGALYIAGVFLAYFGIGIGLFRFFYQFMDKTRITDLVYPAIGSITMILSIISFYDAYTLLKPGSENKPVILQLPKPIKQLINSLTSAAGASSFFIPMGFLLGCAVSLLEFFCTGQIYLPTIIYMLKFPEFRALSLFMLAFYSFMFILPLTAIFISLLVALKKGRIMAMNKNQSGLVKALTGILFLGLSAAIFYI